MNYYPLPILAAALCGCAPGAPHDIEFRTFHKVQGHDLHRPEVETPSGDVARLRIAAESFLGVPYLWGGEGEDGIDCSALVQRVFRRAYGMRLPRTAAQQGALGTRIPRSGLRPGDLVFFGAADSVDHVGIYMGENRFVNATTSSGVRYSDLDEVFWKMRYRFARRLQP